MGRYSKILRLLDELREAENRDWDYDPHDYRRDRQIEDIARIEKELDSVFARIVARVSLEALDVPLEGD